MLQFNRYIDSRSLRIDKDEKQDIVHISLKQKTIYSAINRNSTITFGTQAASKI